MFLNGLRRTVASLCVAASSLLGTPRARAQGLETTPVVADQTILGSVPGTRWRHGEPRWFVASRIDAGFFFLRPRVSAGYGAPHFSWVGVDLTPIISTSALGAYMGARIERPFFELRSGALYQYSFNRSYLPQQPAYSRRDIDILWGDRAQYWLWDSQLEIYAPLGPLRFRSETQPIYATGFPDDANLYLDTLWVVIGPGLTLRQRIGFEYFLPGTNIGVTPAAELLWLDDRDAIVVRAGAQLRWLLSDELQIRSSILPVIFSPDTLGRTGGDVLEVAVRWLWASQ